MKAFCLIMGKTAFQDVVYGVEDRAQPNKEQQTPKQKQQRTHKQNRKQVVDTQKQKERKLPNDLGQYRGHYRGHLLGCTSINIRFRCGSKARAEKAKKEGGRTRPPGMAAKAGQLAGPLLPPPLCVLAALAPRDKSGQLLWFPGKE